MARYIDAIEFLKGIEDIYGRGTTYGVVKELIKSQPSADVVEVKHGKWIGRLFQWGNEDEYPILEESNYLECSECGHLYYLCVQDFFGGLHKVPTRSGENVIPNGCPNCLAKMDGRSDT